jgi:hypothetical protein
MNCYFDTSIYNQILDDPDKDKIVQKIREKHLTAIPSLVNLCEILMTPDAERKRKLLSIYDEIRDDYHALKPFTILLRDAILAIQKGEADIDVNMPVVIRKNTERLCRYALKDTGKEFDEYALKAREWLFYEQKSTALPDAKTFFRISYEKRMIPIWKEIIRGASEELGIKDLSVNDDFILQTVTSPKSIWKYYLDTFLLIFHRRAMRSEGYGRKSNPGGVDLIQGLYLAWANIFVIKDNNFYSFMRELKDIQGYQKEIFTYDEFKEYLRNP